ncbi:hypothetical protein ACP70R_038398 [Stipagrostis hirtigluma subsp. patula]
MASCSHTWRLFSGVSPAAAASASAPAPPRSRKPTKVFAGLPRRRKPPCFVPSSGARRARIRCVKDDSIHFDPSKIEPPPYSSYLDSTSGQLEPASGARASIPGKEYWPEGTAARVRAARAPAPVGESAGSPSFGQKPGSRRRGYKEQVASASAGEVAETGGDDGEPFVAVVDSDDGLEEPKDSVDEYVIYETPQEEELSEYDMDKMMGQPHPFIDPAKAMSLGEPKTSEELWWNWRRKSEKEMWSRWQRRRPDVDTVFAKAMAETGQIKIFGDHPTRTEAALAKTRRHLYKEERLEAERRRLEEIGPIAYYSEWVEAYKHKDTSREAVQKHFEETGEDENAQLITMFQHQTAGEYRIMMGTDIRIQRDPLAMRMREDQIKQRFWGGDPVYPTINYVQDPDEVIDYRGPEFHEPTPEVVPYLMEHGIMITKEELYARLNEEREDVNQDITYIPEVKDPMATAVDIGEPSYNEDSDDEEEDVDKAAAQPESLEDEEDDGDADEVEEKVGHNWSVLKSTGQAEKPKEKSKKGEMSLKEAIDDSENLTDFLMDFEEDE